jgi:hypothetical protein
VGEPSAMTVYGASILGLSRYAAITRVSGEGVLRAENYSGSMVFSSPDASYGNLFMQWDNSGSGFSPAQDFTDGHTVSGIEVDLSGDHVSDTYVLVTDSLGGFAIRHETAPTNEGGHIYFYAFADFSGGVDWTKIVTVEYYLFGVGNGDYTMDFIRTENRHVPDSVGTLALMSIALGLLGIARRKISAQ